MALNILVYSDDRNTREQVRLALGKRPDAELPELAYLECATAPAVVRALDEYEKGSRRIDLLVLDGEAVPLGGMGLTRQLKEEIYQCPPVLVLIGRPQDSWLATWSHADAAVPAPIDPVALVGAATALLRGRAGLAA
ncbi:response regulator transcription factor [Streptacidiphilus melanogenes]|uniref:response regulator transcription factor n=1 Tax=Streptacidiphilus melanogenes TaxID=411235 RepID=UPI0005A9ECFC|nr:response regulator transcription factor [Streptacidiphilus melanogenes]